MLTVMGEPIGPLVGCAAKLKRAQTHADELKRLILAFQAANPYPARLYFDENTGEGVGVLTKDMPQPPSHEWGPIIGDIGHNLASALDHLVCVLSVANGGKADCIKTEFPIFATEKGEHGYDKDGAWRVGSLSDADQATIRGLQPYHAGNDARSRPLWLLRELNRIDKHRRIHTVGFVPQEQFMTSKGLRGAQIVNLRARHRTKAGEEILRFGIRLTGGKPEGDLQFAATVAYVREDIFPKFEGTVGKLPY